MLTAVGLILLGYLMGSVPTGFWLVKALKGIDIRTVGSGSTGATNVLRAAGKAAAAFTLIADAAKGYFPVWLAIHLENSGIGQIPWSEHHLVPTIVALATLIGHSKSIFLKFQGGKSAATALGTLLALNLWAGSLTFASWIFLVWATRFVSIASMMAGVLSGLLMAIFHTPISYVLYCMAGALLVIIRHRPNIQRLMAGTEPKIGQKPAQLPQPGEPPQTQNVTES